MRGRENPPPAVLVPTIPIREACKRVAHCGLCPTPGSPIDDGNCCVETDDPTQCCEEAWEIAQPTVEG